MKADRLQRQAITFRGNHELIQVLKHLPDRLRFDGTMEGENRVWLQFTELDDQSPSFGASFYLDAREALLAAILTRREEKRREFAQEGPRP